MFWSFSKSFRKTRRLRSWAKVSERLIPNSKSSRNKMITRRDRSWSNCSSRRKKFRCWRRLYRRRRRRDRRLRYLRCCREIKGKRILVSIKSNNRITLQEHYQRKNQMRFHELICHKRQLSGMRERKVRIGIARREWDHHRSV